jgi:phosphatidate cytidylyltransferase
MNINTETSTRVKTGVVAGIAFLSTLLFGGFLGVVFLTVLLTGLMVWELTQVFYHLPDKKEKSMASFGAAWLLIFGSVLAPRSTVEFLVLALLLYFSYFLATAGRHPQQLREHFMELLGSCFILIYPVSFMLFLPWIRSNSHGLEWTILFFLIVWGGDTGAYFAGRRFGGEKLYPLISPGKTLSGALGGLASGFVLTFLAKLTFFKAMGWLTVFLAPVAVGITAQIGDLCESFLKRAFVVKDSGQLLPGHGGILDRFDGVLFSLPVMYFCMKAFG